MARATTEYVGNDCRGTYEQVHVLRPAGRDWIGRIAGTQLISIFHQRVIPEGRGNLREDPPPQNTEPDRRAAGTTMKVKSRDEDMRAAAPQSP